LPGFLLSTKIAALNSVAFFL